ncbi:unnamed protein product [Discula destructiva]
MDIEPPILQQAPPLDPAWLAHESATTTPLGSKTPMPITDPVARQPQYAAACRARNTALLAPGARDHHLSQGIATTTLFVPSSKDGRAIPVLQYTRTRDNEPQPQCVVIYYHGGGLLVGEPDSEDLSCRRLVQSHFAHVTLYSVGYRLKPQHPAQTCLDDSIDAFDALVRTHPTAKIIIIGSSSGGQLAALVSQHALRTAVAIHGILLRCPVTSDGFRGEGEYVPARFRAAHTSARHPSFRTTLLERLDMDGPRDGLARMPLEAELDALRALPRTWIQVCTNDVLYSDGACYMQLLREAGVEVRVDVVVGWPHTFWLKAPHLAKAMETEEAMIEGLRWVLGINE